MLKKIKFKKDFRCFKEGEEIEFRPGVNLLVGDQGVGKSTIIQVLTKKGDKPIGIVADPIKLRSFDFEKHNPRSQGFGGKHAVFNGLSHFQSHGEIVKILIKVINEEMKTPILYLMDEPDTALSIRSCVWLVKNLKASVKKGNQLICAVHNPIIIEAFEEVIDVGNRRWVKSKKFIKEQLK